VNLLHVQKPKVRTKEAKGLDIPETLCWRNVEAEEKMVRADWKSIIKLEE